MHNSREKQLRSCASAHHAPKHVDAPTIAPKSPARVLLRLRAVLLLPIYHRQTRACDGWQTHYYTLSVIQNAQRNRTPHEKQARIWRTAVRKPPIAPIEPSTWPALAIRYCRPMIRSLGYLVGGKVGIDRPGIACSFFATRQTVRSWSAARSAGARNLARECSTSKCVVESMERAC